MINKNFYPTPSNIVDKMVGPFVIDHGRGKRLPFLHILEPSAGKGDIIDHLVNSYNVDVKRISCIEIEPELRMILSSKGYKVINFDFMEYRDSYSFDLVLMNPPFDDAADHLLKAWELLTEGDIVCIVNAETINNPYTEKRKLIQNLIKAHGKCEMVGQIFKNAERKTSVDCAIIWLKKTNNRQGSKFEAADFERDRSFDDAKFTANPLAHPDLLQSIVAQFEEAQRCIVEIHKLHHKLFFYTHDVVKYAKTEEGSHLNQKIDELKQQFWDYIFQKTKVEQVTTSEFRKKFEQFKAETGSLAFSKANILSILEMFYLNRDQIMKDCISQVFDDCTAFHEKNKVWVEGWKHNKSWRVAPKIILPYGIGYEPKWDSWTMNHYRHDFFRDIDKVLCFISGKDINSIMSLDKAMSDRCHALNQDKYDGTLSYDDVFSSTFFDIRVFKKGTVHLIFKDKDLLARFNQAAAEGKGWIGSGE